MPQYLHNNTFLQDLKCLFKTLKLTHIQAKSHCIVRSVIQVELNKTSNSFLLFFCCCSKIGIFCVALVVLESFLLSVGLKTGTTIPTALQGILKILLNNNLYLIYNS